MANKSMDGLHPIHHPEHGDLAQHGLGNTFGPNDFIKLESTWGGSAELCVEAWIKPTKTTGDFQAILSPADGKFIHLQIRDKNEGAVSIYTNKGVVELPMILEQPLNHWKHVAVSAKSGESQLYIDGNPYGDINKMEFDHILPSDEVYIGCGYDKGRHFVGEIADLKIWSKARTHDQIHGDIHIHTDVKIESVNFELEKIITTGGLQSAHGKYLSAQPDGRMECNRGELKGWEIFTVREVAGRKDFVALHTAHNTYLTIEEGDVVSCKSKTVGEAQIWKRETANGKVGFKSAKGKYLSAQSDGSLQCNRDALKGWELFGEIDPNKEPGTPVVIAKSNSGFKSAHGKYLSAQPDGRMECNRDALKGWEIFAVEPIEGKAGYASLKTIHNTYLSAGANWSVNCGAKTVGENEIWKIESAAGKVGFKSSKGKYLSAQPGGNLQCNRGLLRGWELFGKEDK